MVVLPVFLQAPWVRLHPFSAAVFTTVLVAVGVVLGSSADEQRNALGQLLVGFSGSWRVACSGAGSELILCCTSLLKPLHCRWQ